MIKTGARLVGWRAPATGRARKVAEGAADERPPPAPPLRARHDARRTPPPAAHKGRGARGVGAMGAPLAKKIDRWRLLPPAVTALPVSAALAAAEKDGRLKTNNDRAFGATLERAAKTRDTPPRAVKASKRDPERNADGGRRYIYHIVNYR